jgi:hypothetical protein
MASLPPRGLPQGVKPAVKEPLIDLLDPRYGLAGERFPARWRAGVRSRPSGRRKLLLVTTDNDFSAETPTWVWAFAVDPADLTAPWRAGVPLLRRSRRTNPYHRSRCRCCCWA